MPGKYIQRALEPVLRRAAREFPVVVLIRAFRQGVGDRAARGFVIHPGDLRLPLGPDATAWPFAEL